MHVHHREPALLLACFLLIFSGVVLANDVTADCTGSTPGAFTSISDALNSLPLAGPNSVFVIGTCHENVTISGRSSLVIFANPGAATLTTGNANRRLLFIIDSIGIFIDGVNF